MLKTKKNTLTNKSSTYPELKFFKGNALSEVWLCVKTNGIYILCTDFKGEKYEKNIIN